MSYTAKNTIIDAKNIDDQTVRRASLANKLDSLSIEDLHAATKEIYTKAQDKEAALKQIDSLLRTIARGKYTPLINDVTVKSKPVPIDQFINDEYYLGLKGSVWPELHVAANEIISGNYVEALLTGAIGIGKTTLAQIINAYFLYCLSLEHFPQRKYGLMPSSTIVFAMLNRTESLARDVTYREFYNLITQSPYFKEEFSFNKEVKSKLVFSNNIEVIYSGAHSKSLLGKNVISGIIDEMNFMSVIDKSKQAIDGETFDQATEVYRSLTRRRKSRFLSEGNLPGCLCLVSSTSHPDDFTEKRIKELDHYKEDDNPELTYVWKKSQWQVVPPDRFTGKKFILELGDEKHAPRVIENINQCRAGLSTLQIPVEYKRDFEKDIEGSLRDIAGVTTLSKQSFIGSREDIWHMSSLFEREGYTPIFSKNVIYSDEDLPSINPDFELKNKDIPRAAHIDLAVTGDSCGVAVGYAVDVTTVKRYNPVTKKTEVEQMPKVIYDLLFTVIPVEGVEVDFGEIRKLLYYLRDTLHIPIKWVTFDGFQSVDSRQVLRKKGFITDYRGVDGKNSYPSYNSLKQGILNKVIMCEEHATCFRELEQLERNPKNNLIDHPINGSKDTADAMCGVYVTLLKRRASWVSRQQPTSSIKGSTRVRPSRNRL